MAAEEGIQTLMFEFSNSNRALGVSPVDRNMHSSLFADLLIYSLVQHN